MFRGSVKSTGYPTPFASFPYTSPPVRHRVPPHFNWTILISLYKAKFSPYRPWRQRTVSHWEAELHSFFSSTWDNMSDPTPLPCQINTAEIFSVRVYS